MWAEQPVYVKKFFGDQAQKYLERDAAGIAQLQAAGLNTPPMLFKGEVQNEQAYVLIFTEIEDATNAEEAWLNLTEKSCLSLAKKLVQEVAKHHNAGLVQTDLYLKNFLVQNLPDLTEKIFTLDGDGIRKFAYLSKQKALENLSVLLSKFDVLALENWLPDLLKTYAATRNWQDVPDLTVIKNLTNAHRRLVASHYADKKVFRTCTDVKVNAPAGLFYAVARADANGTYESAALPTSIVELDASFTPQNIIKNGRSSTVATVIINDKKIVIKRYNIKSFWHGVSRALRPTRAAASWANAHRLKILGIATANPVALIEKRPLGLRGKAYFLAEYIDAPDALEYFKSTSNKVYRAAAVKNIATLFYRLYLLQISHGDMKATNIKIQNNNPVLIDLDSMRQHSNASRAWQAHMRDLQRFMQNWKSEPALYNAFVKAFKVTYTDQSPLAMANIIENKS